MKFVWTILTAIVYAYCALCAAFVTYCLIGIKRGDIITENCDCCGYSRCKYKGIFNWINRL